MTDSQTTPESRFLNRVQRRVAFLKVLSTAELGIYLSPEPEQRKRTIERLITLIARQSELPHLSPTSVKQAYDIINEQLEAMQKTLPHDVQYRNRLRPRW
jgi:hypothetical protein